MAGELPAKHIVIGSQQLKQLQKNVWSDRYVQAVMTAGGNKANIQIRYRGGHTREYPKRSYEVIRGGKTYHYNAEYDDPSLIRNALSFRFFNWIGVPGPATKHCLLIVNGVCLGVYLEIEGVDRSFFRQRGISVQSLFYAVNDHANFDLLKPGSKRRKAELFSGYQQIMGNPADRRKLKRFIHRLNTTKDAHELKAYLYRRIDIDNYLRWLAGAVLTGNYDGFEQNYAIYRHRAAQKYRMIPWDYEGTWGRNCYGKPCGSDLVRITGYNRLTRKLLQYAEVRRKYKRLLVKLLQTEFTVSRILPAAESMHNQIKPYMKWEPVRKWPIHVFDGELQFIRKYIEERRTLVTEAIKEL